MPTDLDYALISAKEWLTIIRYTSNYTENETSDIIKKIFLRVKKYADQEHVSALMFLLKELPPFSNEEYTKLITAAVKLNSAEAMLQMAICHSLNLHGFKKDLDLAAKYLRKAVDCGNKTILQKIKTEFSEFSNDKEINPIYYNNDYVINELSPSLIKLATILELYGIDLLKIIRDEKEFYEPYFEKISEEEKKYLEAAKKGEYAIVEHYLRNGGNPIAKESSLSKTALHMAAERTHIEIVKLILTYYKKYDLPVDSIESQRQDTPLSLACCVDSGEIVRILLEAGANPFRENCVHQYSAFTRASTRNCESAMKSLYDYTKKHYLCFVSDNENKHHVVRLDIGVYGCKHEYFTSSLSITTHSFHSSADSDPMLEEINSYLNKEFIDPIVKKYDKFGGITTNLNVEQTIFVFNFIEFQINHVPNTKIICKDDPLPITTLKKMRQFCKLINNPDLASLSLESLYEDSRIEELWSIVSGAIHFPEHILLKALDLLQRLEQMNSNKQKPQKNPNVNTLISFGAIYKTTTLSKSEKEEIKTMRKELTNPRQ